MSYRELSKMTDFVLIFLAGFNDKDASGNTSANKANANANANAITKTNNNIANANANANVGAKSLKTSKQTAAKETKASAPSQITRLELDKSALDLSDASVPAALMSVRSSNWPAKNATGYPESRLGPNARPGARLRPRPSLQAAPKGSKPSEEAAQVVARAKICESQRPESSRSTTGKQPTAKLGDVQQILAADNSARLASANESRIRGPQPQPQPQPQPRPQSQSQTQSKSKSKPQAHRSQQQGRPNVAGVALAPRRAYRTRLAAAARGEPSAIALPARPLGNPSGQATKRTKPAAKAPLAAAFAAAGATKVTAKAPVRAVATSSKQLQQPPKAAHLLSTTATQKQLANTKLATTTTTNKHLNQLNNYQIQLRQQQLQPLQRQHFHQSGNKMADQSVIDKLEAGFAKLQASTPEQCHSLLKKYLTREVLDKLKTRKTAMGATLLDIVQSGFENLDSGVGIYAPDAESYTLFAELFNPIIEDYHGGFKPTDKHPQSDFGDLDTLVNVDPTNEFVISTRVRCGRSLQGYPFNPCLTEAQYKEMEDKVSSALKGMDGDLAGTYYPLTGMTKETQQKLIDDHFLFKEGDRFLQAANACRFWPTGRGIFHNDAKSFLVWVNEEDHLRIISMQKGGDLKQIYSRMVRGARAIESKVPFSRDDRLGFLTFCPTNLGTTIRASVHIKLPKLAADRKKLEEVAGRYNLQVRGTSGEHTESVGGVYDISNKRRLGLTEYQAVREMQDGILELIKIEKSL